MDDADFTQGAPNLREAQVSEQAQRDAVRLSKQTLTDIPVCVASRMATCMAESIEGCVAGSEEWGFLARYRSRLLLAPVPEGVDRNEELKRRLQLWERGNFNALVHRVACQQLEDAHAGSRYHGGEDDERRGRRARLHTAAGARSKAVKGLVGGVAPSTAAERGQWTAGLIPRSEVVGGPCTQELEHQAAKECTWGRGDQRQARKEMREAGKRPGSHAGIPWVKLAPWCAPGPSGDRQEHLDGMLRFSAAGVRRRLVRALDLLTVGWATNSLPASCRWLLNTQALFLKKSREPTCKLFGDAVWLDWLAAQPGDAAAAEAEEWSEDVPESDVVGVGPEVSQTGDVTMEEEPALPAEAARPQVRPIQMGEHLRKWVTKRLQHLNEADINRVMTAMRQLGVGTSGGAEALATLHQLLYEIWRDGELERPLARIKVDERNCFGSLEWPAIRKASLEALLRHFAVACWKHAEESTVEQKGVDPVAKDCGAEQGDVDGPLECSLTLGGVAAKTRQQLHERQGCSESSRRRVRQAG